MLDVVCRLSHRLYYNLTCKIETSEKAEHQWQFEKQFSSSSFPKNEDEYVITIFWVNNFDMRVDSQIGSNSINTNHMVAFQKESLARIIHQQAEFLQIDQNIITIINPY